MTTTSITGANKGLGKETARSLVTAGDTVWLGAQDDETRGRAVAQGAATRIVQLDVTDDASVAVALPRMGAEGALDILVNAAGIAKRVGGGEAPHGPSALEVLNTNIRVIEAAPPRSCGSSTPVVVNVSSALGSFWATHVPSRPASPYPAIVYASSKAAVSMVTVQYAKAAPEVEFNAVEPGVVASELGGAGIDSHQGPPATDSAEVVARLACLGEDGPTGTLQEDDGALL